MRVKHCYNCGEIQNYLVTYPVDIELQRTWGISQQLRNVFNRREGLVCKNCGVNVRAQGLAKAILDSKFGYKSSSLKEWVKIANSHNLMVCELNSCHELHQTLKKLNNLTYAEYGTKTEQNIEKLTYKNNSFDLFLHSETLEHVSNPEIALGESRRVIKPTGLILFTTPVIWARKTKRRAKINNKKITYLVEPSYHGKRTDDYLVFFEYGHDIDKILGVTLTHLDWRNQNYIFVSKKAPTRIEYATKLKLRILEKLAQKRKA